jgi:hypothetical protein
VKHKIPSEGTRSFEGTAEIVLPNGEVAVSAEGKYMKATIDRITNDIFTNDEWFLEESPDDPTEIEMSLNDF